MIDCCWEPYQFHVMTVVSSDKAILLQSYGGIYTLRSTKFDSITAIEQSLNKLIEEHDSNIFEQFTNVPQAVENLEVFVHMYEYNPVNYQEIQEILSVALRKFSDFDVPFIENHYFDHYSQLYIKNV